MSEKKLPCDRALLEEIAAKYGTPYYLYDEAGIRRKAQEFRRAFSWAPEGSRNFYALKACPNHFILIMLAEEGMGVDCSSVAELELASRVGLTGNLIMFSSNSTTAQAYAEAARRGAIINIDDPAHIEILLQETGFPGTVCFRYNPGDEIQGTAIIGKGTEAKFGCPSGMIESAYRSMRDLAIEKGLQPEYGMHIMAGSNRLDTEYFSDVAGVMFGLAASLSEKLGIRFSFINLGGGIGVAYRPEEREPDLDSISSAISLQYDAKIRTPGLDPIKIFMENGRAITGPHGFFVARAQHVESKHREYVRVDAAEAQFPRPGIYGAYHHIIIPGKEHEEHDHIYDVAGGMCENWKFAENRKLPEIRRGDLVVMCDAGAHCFAMITNYNGWPKPPELLLREDGSVMLIRRRQSTHEQYRDIPLAELNRFSRKRR
ncbi:diaminopimelate decarboxylase [Candidatus Woesearchaeota archaeon]|nr:diaminopimelate decarboxylase [Candidatus Woesearchaeota archaeon]